MTALSALLQQGDCDGAQRYVAGWQGQLTQIETETWCRNPAVHACETAPEGAPRYIKLELSLSGGQRLTLHVENPCYEFDRGGFPAVPCREGHGQGLHSIAAVAEKYHGIFHCAYEEQRFILRVVFLHEIQTPRKRNRTPAVCNAGEAEYFLPGGIWADEECFESIDPDQNFYIDENGQLVIVFAEYEVAPGSMGEPESVIPTDVLDGFLAQPSVLR